MTDQLFDANAYGTSTHKPHRSATIGPPIEPHVEPWTYIRNRKGVVPYAHLVAANLTHAGVLTCCGLRGSTLTNAGVTDMIRCPICQLDTEM